MASRQDYANKKPKRTSQAKKSTPAKTAAKTKRAPAKPARKFPFKLLAAAVIGVGVLGYFLNSIVQMAPSPSTSPPPPETKPVEVAPAPVKKAEPAKDKQYTFYKDLPKTKVDTSNAGDYKSTPKDPEEIKQYLLQAGSFRSHEDAERMRAQLLLLGLPNVRSEKSESDNGTWFRVRSGPFEKEADLNRAKARLVKEGIKPLVVKMKP